MACVTEEIAALKNRVTALEAVFPEADEAELLALRADLDALAAEVALLDAQRHYITIEQFGADGTEAGDSDSFKEALLAAVATWRPILFPARVINWDGSDIPQNFVRLWGSGMPGINAGGTQLERGTRFARPLLGTGEFVEIRDIGIDIGPSTDAPVTDAFKWRATGLNTGRQINIINLRTLGRAKESNMHSVLIEGFAEASVENIRTHNGLFGLVSKNRKFSGFNVGGTNHGDAAIYSKGDSSFGLNQDFQLNHWHGYDSAHGLRVQADSSLVESIQIDKGRTERCNIGRFIQIIDVGPESAMRSVQLGDMISEGNLEHDTFIYNLKPGSAMKSIQIGDSISEKPKGRVLTVLNEAGATIQSVEFGKTRASYDPADVAAALALPDPVDLLAASVFMGAGVDNSYFETASILVDHGADSRRGTISYQGVLGSGNHSIGYRDCNVAGANRPGEGFSEVTVAGSDVQLEIPFSNSGKNSYIVEVNHDAEATIGAFVMPRGAVNVEAGSRLAILNRGATVLNIPNNGADGIINVNAAGFYNVALQSNGIHVWTMSRDGVWRSE